MNRKFKITLIVLSISVTTILGFIAFKPFIMSKGDLASFNQKVKDGDVIFRCKYSGESGQTNEFGIIEKSWGSVYVWDDQNTMKQNLQAWTGKGNGGRVKVFRIKEAGFDINKAELENGAYNHLMTSDKMEFVTESY